METIGATVGGIKGKKERGEQSDRRKKIPMRHLFGRREIVEKESH